MIKIDEVFLKSKYTTENLCEDGLILTDHYVGVVDGATSQEVCFLDKKKSGRWISETICKAFQGISVIRRSDVISHINAYLCDRYRQEGIYDLLNNYPFERPCASAAICDFNKNEIIIIGDCQCVVDGKIYRTEGYLDIILASIRSIINEYHLAKGYSINDIMNKDIGREYILPILQNRKIFQNTLSKSDFTYYAIDGFPVPFEGIVNIKITNDTKCIILATDGYPKLFDTLKESEVYLKDLIYEDPLCIKRFKSTKGLCSESNSFDDRAYIKINIKS